MQLLSTMVASHSAADLLGAVEVIDAAFHRRQIVTMAVALNLVVALIFGWLFWHHGLLAAIVAHALVHAMWYPLERN